MSLLAGIYSLDDTPIDPSWVASIQANLSRKTPPHHEYQDPRLYLAKIDLGLLPGAGYHRDATVAMVTGEPLYAASQVRVANRDEDARIMAGLPLGDPEGFRRCRGSFSFAGYDPGKRELVVAVDRLGMRAIYYHRGPRHLFFSSSLRMLESLIPVPKRVDLRGVTEQVVFGVPLADRTPYADIQNLRGGEFLRARPGHVDVVPYARWGEIPATSMAGPEFQEEAFRVFREAVACRGARSKTAVSFLTGGLDSRCILGALALEGKEIFTLNFQYPGLIDAEIAPRLAQSVGAHHAVWPVPDWRAVSTITISAPARVPYPDGAAPEHPRVVFSGDGGSVGLGFVYMDERILSLVRQGRLDELAEYYFRRKQLPRRIFRPEVFEALHRLPEEGWREELRRAGGREPGKDFHIFLMENDQRRHLHHMLEDLDVNSVELLLPFYDTRWLELIGSAPVDWFLLHRFYYDFIRLFPQPIHAIPWQAYPGHLPCPLVEQPKSRPQWDLPKSLAYRSGQAAYDQARRSLLSRKFPSPLFRRNPLLTGAVVHGLRARNLAYFWRTFEVFERYYAKSGGSMVWP